LTAWPAASTTAAYKNDDYACHELVQAYLDCIEAISIKEVSVPVAREQKTAVLGGCLQHPFPPEPSRFNRFKLLAPSVQASKIFTLLLLTLSTSMSPPPFLSLGAIYFGFSGSISNMVSLDLFYPVPYFAKPAKKFIDKTPPNERR